MTKFFTAIAASFLALAVVSCASDEIVLPSGGKLITYSPELSKLARKNEFSSISKATIEDAQYPQVLDVIVHKQAPKIWNIQVPFTFKNAKVNIGDVVLFKIVARSVSSSIADGSVGQMDLFFKYMQPGKPVVNKRLMLSKEWQTFYVPAKVKSRTSTENMTLSLLLGGLPIQHLQIAELEVYNYGADMNVAKLPMTKIKYFGHEADAPWRSEANARIEQNRKAYYGLTLLDANKQPINNAKVEFELNKHQYGFGCGLQALKLFNDDYMNDESRQKELNNIEDMCNIIVLNNALKWRYHRPERVAKAMQWAKERDLKVRGHALVWGRFTSAHRDIENKQDFYKKNPEKFQQEILKHVTEFASLYPEQITGWDVINEPAPEHHFVDILGKEATIEWLNAAKKANPNALRCANDYAVMSRYDTWHQDAYYDWVKYFTKHNAIEKVCVQGHYQGPMPITEIYQRLERFAQFGLPISMTEFDYFEVDPELKAQFTRDLITIFFSHPSTDMFIHWNLADLYNENGQLTLSGQAYDKLIHQVWHTKGTTTSNALGLLAFRGFKGDYKVKVTLADGTQSSHMVKFTKQAQQVLQLD